MSYHGAYGATLKPSGPEEIAESIAEAIRDKRADKENGKTLLKQYLHGMGVQFRQEVGRRGGSGWRRQTISRDQQLLMVQALILTGVEGA